MPIWITYLAQVSNKRKEIVRLELSQNKVTRYLESDANLDHALGQLECILSYLLCNPSKISRIPSRVKSNHFQIHLQKKNDHSLQLLDLWKLHLTHSISLASQRQEDFSPLKAMMAKRITLLSALSKCPTPSSKMMTTYLAIRKRDIDDDHDFNSFNFSTSFRFFFSHFSVLILSCELYSTSTTVTTPVSTLYVITRLSSLSPYRKKSSFDSYLSDRNFFLVWVEWGLRLRQFSIKDMMSFTSFCL